MTTSTARADALSEPKPLAVSMTADAGARWFDADTGRDSTEALWERLASQEGVPINADPSRYLATMRALGPRAGAHIAVLGDPRQPSGMVIARESTQRAEIRVGYWKIKLPWNSRTLDVVAGGVLECAGASGADDAAEYLFNLAAGRRFDLIRVHRLEATGTQIHRLSARQHRNPPKVRVAHREAHWVMELTDEPIRLVSSKRRGQIRRERRNLEAHFGGDVSLLELRDPADVPQAIAWASAMEAGTYKDGLGVAMGNSSVASSLMRDDAERGRWRSWFLMAGDEPIAFVVGAVYHGTFFLEYTGYAREHASLSPGKAAIAQVAEVLHRQGVQRIDFGIGDAAYKQVFGTFRRETATVLIPGRSWRARVTALGWVTADWTQAVSEKCFEHFGVLGTLKRRWRARLAKRGRCAHAA